MCFDIRFLHIYHTSCAHLRINDISICCKIEPPSHIIGGFPGKFGRKCQTSNCFPIATVTRCGVVVG
jgi:hypothetical protein